MKISRLSIWLIFIPLCVVGSGIQQKKRIKKKPHIPSEVLFKPTTHKLSPRLSPDAKNIAFLGLFNGVMNLWLRSLENQEEKPITHDNHRGIHQFLWSFDSNQIFYLQDTDGDENWRLYGLDLATGNITCYTPFDNVQVHIVEYNKHYPSRMLIGLNDRDPQYHDLYELDIKTKEISLKRLNDDHIIDWITNDQLDVVGYVKKTEQGYNQLLIKSEDQWRLYGTWDLDDIGPYPVVLSKDEKTLFMIDARNADTAELVALDVQTGNKMVLAHHDDYDVNGQVLVDQNSHQVLAISFLQERTAWIFFDNEIQDDFKILQMLDYGDIAIESRDNNDQYWIVSFSKDDGPISYWLYDRHAKNGTFLFDHQDELNEYVLAPMHPITLTARDGLLLHGYLTLPVNRKPPFPLMLLVHGGPWARDTWGFSPLVQWFANRGLAVLQINFRGSTGYGKKFVNAANKEWAGKMHDDLIDAVQWAVDNKIADAEKVAIFGGSYGGYAALVGAAFTPDVFCCAIDVVGPSNLLTLIESIPPYWKAELQRLYHRVGNPYTETEFLKSRSPLFKAHDIKKPLLIAQGANDPRVKQAESEQIVRALKEKGLEYEYLLYKDEGHGFLKPANQMHFMQHVEMFLARNLYRQV